MFREEKLRLWNVLRENKQIPECPECQKTLSLNNGDVERLVQICTGLPSFTGNLGHSSIPISCGFCNVQIDLELKPIPKEHYLYLHVSEALKNPKKRVVLLASSLERFSWDSKLRNSPSTLDDEQLKSSLKFHSSKKGDEHTLLFASAQKELHKRQSLKTISLQPTQNLEKPKEGILKRIKGAFS